MRTLIVNEKYNNKKLNTFLQDNFSGLSSGTFYKALRNKDIIVNKIRIRENIIVHENDEVTVYITDDFLFKNYNYNIVYEDENILIVNKPYDIEVICNNPNDITLTSLLRKKLGKNIFPCHRLDRNTTGLVLFAKNTQALNIMLEKFKFHEIEKYYKCTVVGIPNKKQDTLKAFLFKDTKKSLVYIYDQPKKGTSEIITSYKTLDIDSKNNLSILEVLLCTGKTHQIRAHLAHIGHPILGDGKYGINNINKKFGKTIQELCAYKIKFSFKTDSGILNYLNKKEFKIQ